MQPGFRGFKDSKIRPISQVTLLPGAASLKKRQAGIGFEVKCETARTFGKASSKAIQAMPLDTPVKAIVVFMIPRRFRFVVSFLYAKAAS